jgi:catechol 2,3-dioxygenase-like lactoylglutathione lyase family enzyme
MFPTRCLADGEAGSNSSRIIPLRGVPYPPDKPVCDEGITHFDFQVEDIDDLYEKLYGLGVRFNNPPQVIRPGVKAAYFHNPDGITAEFVQYS